jgi:hypothetical protein
MPICLDFWLRVLPIIAPIAAVIVTDFLTNNQSIKRMKLDYDERGKEKTLDQLEAKKERLFKAISKTRAIISLYFDRTSLSVDELKDLFFKMNENIAEINYIVLTNFRNLNKINATLGKSVKTLLESQSTPDGFLYTSEGLREKYDETIKHLDSMLNDVIALEIPNVLEKAK